MFIPGPDSDHNLFIRAEYQSVTFKRGTEYAWLSGLTSNEWHFIRIRNQLIDSTPTFNLYVNEYGGGSAYKTVSGIWWDETFYGSNYIFGDGWDNEYFAGLVDNIYLYSSIDDSRFETLYNEKTV